MPTTGGYRLSWKPPTVCQSLPEPGGAVDPGGGILSGAVARNVRG